MGHAHDHSHAHAPESYNTAFAVATILNFLFVIAEASYAISANSMSLLADAGHNLGDVAGLLFAWIASWLLTRDSGDQYSYGYKKTTVIAAVLNAVLLIATSVLIARESIEKLIHPGTVHEMTVIIIAFIGIAINGGTALMFMRGREHDLNIKGAFLHLAADTLISLGVVLTGVIILYSGWHLLDPIIGLVIVGLIIWGSWGLLRDSVNLIIDAVPHNVDQVAVRKFLSEIDGVTEVHDLHIWGLSTRENALTTHLVMPQSTMSDEVHRHVAEELVHHHNVHHVTIQVETGDKDFPCDPC